MGYLTTKLGAIMGNTRGRKYSTGYILKRFFAGQIFCLILLTFRPQKLDDQVTPGGD